MRLKQIHLSGIVLTSTWVLIFVQLAGSSAQADRPDKETRMSSPRVLTARKLESDVLEANQEVIRWLYEEALNTGKLDGLSLFVADEYSDPDGRKGPDAFGEPINALRRAFPDIRWTLEDMVADGDRVAARWTWRGTHEAPFREYPATRKPVSNHGMAVFQLKDGKIVRSWIETDRLGFLQQIGVVSQDLGRAPQPRAGATR